METQDHRPPSRSALKRAAKAIEALAAELADLTAVEREKLPVAEATREAIAHAAATAGRGARKREVKHLAGWLRRRPEEVEALTEHMQGLHLGQLQQRQAFHALERLRDRLCDPEGFAGAVEEIAESLPAPEVERLARLARSVQQSGDRRAFREIFRRLREAQPGEPGLE